MNIDLGPFSFSIWSAYGVSALGILGATLWILMAWRKAKTQLATLERKRAD
jgi:heme exporter protein CcmD